MRRSRYALWSLAMILAAATTGLLLAPVSASAASYHFFVGCDDLSETPVASHACVIGDFPAAYFESSEETEYEVCVEFPGGKFLCAEEQLAEAEVLYLNSITTELEGVHTVYWYVGEDEVGSFVFRMNPPPPPPTPPAVVPPAILAPAPVLPTGPSADCLIAQGKVSKLKGRLAKATRRQQKVRLRKALKTARASAKTACL